jgi:isopentenyldiphosphate isomerase
MVQRAILAHERARSHPSDKTNMQTGSPHPAHAFGNQTGPAQRGDEVFDVVDANDVVTGQATRREVHARGLWHRAVHVLVFAPVNETERCAAGEQSSASGGRQVFLQKRSMAKDTAPGCWDSSCSGHVDAGEDYAEAAVRELREEIGLVLSGPEALTPLFKLPASAETGGEFVWVYQLHSRGPFALHPAEIERGEWWQAEELTRAVAERPGEFARAFRFIWGRVLGAER